MSPRNSFYILKTRIDSVDWTTIDQFCRSALVQGAPKMITTINGEIALLARKNDLYRAVLNKAHLAIADSINIVWVARIKGFPIKQPTPGVELVERLCRIASEMKKSVFFLGGFDGAAAKTAEILQGKFPDLEIAGTSEAGPSDSGIASEIRRRNPDIVFVAYGAPRQELWIDQNKDKVTAKIMVGIGGSFDMISGTLRRAPQLFRQLHLEWFWRLLLQPRRIWRVFKAVVIFPFLAIFTKN